MFKEFLTGRALARAQRGLAYLMEAGEQLVAFDVCRTSSDLGQLLGHRGTRVDAVVSDRALYLAPNGDARRASRLPFEDIEAVGFQERPGPGDAMGALQYAMLGQMAKVIVIHLWGSSAIGLMPHKRNGRSEIGPELKIRVPDRTVAEHRIELLEDGRGVTVTQSRGPVGSVGFNWNFACDDGVDVDSGPLSEEFKQRMHRLMRDAGDPNADAPRSPSSPAIPRHAAPTVDGPEKIAPSVAYISADEWEAWQQRRDAMAENHEGLPECPACGREAESVTTGPQGIIFDPCYERIIVRRDA